MDFFDNTLSETDTDIFPQIQEEEEEQQIIPPTIDNEIDIMSIHNIILSYLEKRYRNITKLKQKYDKFQWIYENATSTIEKIQVENNLSEIKREISQIENRKEITTYKQETKDIIQNYLATTPKTDFFNSDIQTPINTSLIEDFLIIAKNYVLINIKFKQTSKCTNCGCTDLEMIEDHLFRCAECNSEIRKLDDSYNFKDSSRLNLTSRYKYSKQGHFTDIIQKFQGKHNVQIKPEVYDDIKEKMKHNGLTEDTLKKEHVYIFLSNAKHGKHYDDVNLIYYELTGKNPPDISQYQEQLEVMSELVEQAFEELKSTSDIKRSSSINVHYKLMKMLEILEYDFNIEDFNFLKTREKILEHDENWKKICTRIGWPYYPTI